MQNRTLFRTGIVGSVIAAVCCATPVLVILLGGVGLSAWVGWLDFVLIPALLGFIGVTLFAWRRLRIERASCDIATEPGPDWPKGGKNG